MMGNKKMRNKKMVNKKIGFLLLAFVTAGSIALSGCSGNTAKKISVVGSTSVAPLAQTLADEFGKKNQDITIDIQSVGSTAGIKAVYDGTCDIGTSSRELSAEEKAWNLKETTIAIDGIAVIVNPANKVANLTKNQITKIFNGEINNWKEVGGINKEILVVSREAGSGTRGAFEELMDLQKKSGDNTISLIVDNALIAEGNGAVMANVAGKDNAIGYMSMGIVDETKVSKISVNGVSATEADVKNGSYPISRPFLMLTKGEPTGDIKDFIDYILGSEGQKIVAEEYVTVK